MKDLKKINKRIKAKYVGKSGCGFKRGEIYKIRTTIYHGALVVFDTEGPGVCPYSRLETFLENWEVI